MFNTPQKVKKVIKDPKKLKQIDSWKRSELSKISSAVHQKDRASFDTTTEFLDNCINYHKKEIEYMLSLGVDIDCSDKDNLTALHQACINAKLDLVMYLLKKNANINAIDKEGWTPLHIAASIGSLELAKCLIDSGARMDIVNYDGDLPIALVDEEEHRELRCFLQIEMNKRNITEALCRNMERNVMMEDIIIWKSTGIYAPPIDNTIKSTPLHVAASKNYLDILIELTPLLRKEDLNACDMDGWTALHAAAHWGNREACLVLMKAGADLDVVTKANETVLEIVDPQIKDQLEEDFRKYKIENIQTIQISNEVSVRNEGNKQRRTSIVRQSVQMKKYAQSKDPLMERQIHDAVHISEPSSVSSSIDDDDEKCVPIKSYNKRTLKDDFCSIVEGDEGSLSQRPSIDIGETKSMSTISVTSPCISDQNDGVRVHKIAEDFKSLSCGDNNSIEIDDAFDIQTNSGVNNAAVCEFSDNTIDDNAVEVKMRPKSVRDSIVQHRSVSNRLSLVMAPAKCDESEANRREKARRVRSNRRSTQAINLSDMGTIAMRKQELENGSVEIATDLITPIKEEENSVDVVDSSPENVTTNNQIVDNSRKNLKNLHNSVTATQSNSSNLISKTDHPSLISISQSSPQDNNKQASSTNTSYKPSPDMKYTPLTRAADVDSKLATKEVDSGSFVAKPMLATNRVKPSDFSSGTNLRATASDVSTHQRPSRPLDPPSISDNNDTKSCRAIADNLTNNLITIKEQNSEILKLRKRIEELEKSPRNVAQLNRNLGEDTEMIRIKKENANLKLQNESLLRVIGKIQQELHSIKHIELPK